MNNVTDRFAVFIYLSIQISVKYYKWRYATGTVADDRISLSSVQTAKLLPGENGIMHCNICFETRLRYINNEHFQSYFLYTNYWHTREKCGRYVRKSIKFYSQIIAE